MKSNLSIIAVSNKKQMAQFFQVPHKIHLGYKSYVPKVNMLEKHVFDKNKNPYWKVASFMMFLALKDGESVGRIAAIIHEKSNKAYFGYFDSIDEQAVVDALLQKVSEYIQKKGFTEYIGPINPGVNYELGVLISGYDYPPFFMMNFNPPYYAKLLENAGAKYDMTFYAYQLKCGINTKKIDRVNKLLISRYPLNIKNINFKNYEEESKILCSIYNDSFAGHWGHVPFEKDEFVVLANSLRSILDKKLVFTLYLGSEPVGFILAIPNMNEAFQYFKNGKPSIKGLLHAFQLGSRIKWVKVMVVAIRKKYQHLGFASLLYAEMARRVEAGGYLGGEISWIADENLPMKKITEEMGGKAYKKYAVFRVRLDLK